MRDRGDADGIAQEVFAKVYFSIHDFEGRSALYAWIYRIAVNECYSFLLKKRVKLLRPIDFLGDALPQHIEAIPDGRSTPDRAALQRDFINGLLARIPQDDRWLLVAKEVEGFSLAELSHMTGSNENALRRRLFRIRQELLEEARTECCTHTAI